MIEDAPRGWSLLADIEAVTLSIVNGVGTITYDRDPSFANPSRLEPLLVDLAERTHRLGVTHVTSTTPWGRIVAQRIGDLIEVATFTGEPPVRARFALCVDILCPAPEHVSAAHAALMGRPECIAVIGLINAMGELPAGPTPYFSIDPAVPATLPPTLRSVSELRIVDAEFGGS